MKVKTPAHIAQGGGGCPILGSIQIQLGFASEQPEPVEDGPEYGRGGEREDL